MQSAISVQDLGKCYRIGAAADTRGNYRTLRESLTNALRRRSFAAGRKAAEDFWALKEVGFEVKPGEAVGIIGRNGAGKSTLLKVLSRITKPTTGEIRLNGRVGSLLEVGAGFHPELTGRENIYLNGSILGMSRREIAQRFDEIVAFAEVEKFLDTPVKRYSSGMYTRLAFSVAAHLEPEILIIDEVLAVGDTAFQKKCLGKMGEVASQGRTVLFVSHNLEAISALTQRCILLRRGRSVADGSTPAVLSEYLQEQNSTDATYVAPASRAKPKIIRLEVQTSRPGSLQVNGAPLDIKVEIASPVGIRGASLSIHIVDAMQRPIVHLWTFDSERPMCREAGVLELHCSIPKLRLYMGQYHLNVYFAESRGREFYEVLEGVCPFTVTMDGRSREWEWRAGACTYLEEADWRVKQLQNSLVPSE